MKSFHFRWKLTICLVAVTTFVSLVSGILVYQVAVGAQREQLRQRLMTLAQWVASGIDAGEIVAIPLEPSSIQDPRYQRIQKYLESVHRKNPAIRYLYTMVRSNEAGTYRFVVEVRTPYDRLTPAGTLFNAARYPEMMKAFEGPSADQDLVEDEWGVALSGYAPIRDPQGRAVAMVGVDMPAQEVRELQKSIQEKTIIVWLVGLVLSIILGIVVGVMVSKPLEKVVAVTDRIASGDFAARIPTIGRDEFHHLAEEINQMAQSLETLEGSRRQHVIQTIESLAMAIEAKDVYTRGHSDRVSQYAVQMALKLGLEGEPVEILRQAAILHDIGKLAIPLAILHKPGKLTPEEYEVVKQHPIVGEQILRPLDFLHEQRRLVRCHHERPDGKGYPDGLSKDKIDSLIAIISVADAFDAMTSDRPYRAAMSIQAAQQELLRCEGAQFDPQATRALCELLPL